MIDEKKRIEFIDLAKGVCISLVVLHHCHIEIPYLIYVRMPLYFILSGLFFKLYTGFFDFTKRKTNKILVPFIFWHVLSFTIYLLIQHFAPGIKVNTVVSLFSIWDPLFSRMCFNNPLWFLLSLFWCNILYYIISMITKNKVGQAIIVIGIAIIAGFIHNEEVFPLYFYNSMYYLPYFFIGSLLKSTDLLYDTTGVSFFQKNKDWILGVACVVLFFVLVNIQVIPHITQYIESTVGVLALLLLLKRIQYVPIISKFGRYSIIILCTSYLVYSPLRVIIPRLAHITGFWSDFIAFILTMTIEYFVIDFCKKYMPHVTAQKDIITVGDKPKTDVNISK